jgi:hypothetical protein
MSPTSTWMVQFENSFAKSDVPVSIGLIRSRESRVADGNPLNSIYHVIECAIPGIDASLDKKRTFGIWSGGLDVGDIPSLRSKKLYACARWYR